MSRVPVSQEHVDELLRQIGALVPSEEEPAKISTRRARLVKGLSAFSDGVFAERSVRRRWALPAVVAALVLGAGLGIVLRGIWGSDASPFQAASGRPLVRAAQGLVEVDRPGLPPSTVRAVPLNLGPHDEVVTGEGHADVVLASGALVELAAKGKLELGTVSRTTTTVDERVSLSSGSIHVRVPKLTQGSRLVIGTPNAAVTVHGTVFTVTVAPETGPTITTVSVSEGLVSVTSSGREIFLGPGSNWSSVSEPVTDAAASAVSDDGGRSVHEADGTGAPRKGSTLMRENVLFRSALAARRAGNGARAIELIDLLLARYPTSPLASEARAERFRAAHDLEAQRPANSGAP